MWSGQVKAWDRENTVSIHLKLQMSHLWETFTHLGIVPVNSASNLVFQQDSTMCSAQYQVIHQKDVEILK